MTVNWLQIGKYAAAGTAILTFLGSIVAGMVWLEINPVLAMDLKKVEKRQLKYAIPLLSAQQRELRVLRAQTRMLPQTNDTVEDLVAITEQIEEVESLVRDARQRSVELED